MSKETIIAMLDCLIPGDATGWPAAGQHGLSNRFLELLDSLFEQADKYLEIMLAELPDNFSALSTEQQTACLSSIESTQPDAFEAVLRACYAAYYTDPRIRQILEKKTGYEARPPQPDGYHLPPFDESLLEPVRARGPIWRKVP